MNEENAFASDLIVLNGTPKAISWDLKDLMSHTVCDDESRLMVGCVAYKYFASMRDIPAQSVQKQVLGDLARVGYPVPPAVDVVAPVTVYLSTGVNRLKKIPIHAGHSQVFMPRGGKDRNMRVLFQSDFVHELVVKIEEIDENELQSEFRNDRTEWLDNLSAVRNKMLHEGMKLPAGKVCKMTTFVGEAKGKNWLEIVVNVSEEEFSKLLHTDLLPG